METTYLILAAIFGAAFIVILLLEVRGWRQTRSVKWAVRRTAGFLGLIFCGYITVAALAPKRVPQQWTADAMEERFCAKSGVDCHPNVSPAASSASLEEFEKRTDAWKAAQIAGNTTPRPNYMSLPLLMPDRIKADDYATSAGLEVSDHTLDKLREAQSARNADFSPADLIPGSGWPMLGRLLVSVLIGSAFVAFIPFTANRNSSQWTPKSIRSFYGSLGYVDGGSGEAQFLKANTKLTRTALVIIAVMPALLGFGIPLFYHMSIAGVTIALRVSNSAAVIGFLCQVVTWFLISHARKSEFRAFRWRYQSKTAPVKTASEHGSARHAADADLHGKGFAEPEIPTDDGGSHFSAGPRFAKTKAEAEAMLAAFRAKLNRKERLIFEKATLAEQVAMMRAHGLIP